MTNQTESILGWQLFKDTVLNDSTLPKEIIETVQDKDDNFWIYLYQSTFLKSEDVDRFLTTASLAR